MARPPNAPDVLLDPRSLTEVLVADNFQALGGLDPTRRLRIDDVAPLLARAVDANARNEITWTWRNVGRPPRTCATKPRRSRQVGFESLTCVSPRANASPARGAHAVSSLLLLYFPSLVLQGRTPPDSYTWRPDAVRYHRLCEARTQTVRHRGRPPRPLRSHIRPTP